MKLEIKRFGLTHNPKKEKRKRNRITKQIIVFLCVFVIFMAIFSVCFVIFMSDNITDLSINDKIDSTWIGSLASYWGAVIGGVFSGVFAFFGVFYTIKYYKESDEQKEKSSIQPFLLITAGADKDVKEEFTLGSNSEKCEERKGFKVTIKNIGNGFASILVIHTGSNFGGIAYKKVISIGESECILLKANPDEFKNGISFGIQYIDSMRNEYIQEYSVIDDHGQINIECGYPGFLEQR